MVAFSEVYRGTLKNQKLNLLNPSVDLTGATVIVTGANAGLGKEVTAKLAVMNASKVIIACRSASKGEAARSDILKTNSSLKRSSIEVWSLDLSDFSSVKTFAERAKAELPRLDILACNAGIWPAKFELTKDGWESALQVNGLATFYLALLLLPLLEQTSHLHYATTRPNSLSKPHLTITLSGLHFMTTLPAQRKREILPAMNDPKGYDAGERYNETKLLEVLFARELGQRIDRASSGGSDSVIVNSVNPGFCVSSLNDSLNKGSIMRRIFFPVLEAIMARPTEMGARAITWAAVSGSEQGSYCSDCADVLPSRFVTSEQGDKVAARVWAEIVDVLTRLDPSLRGGIASV